MRKTKAVLQDGSLETIADNNLLILKREVPGTQLFCILNFGNSSQSIVLSDYFGTYKRNVVATVVSDNSNIRRG
jgi:hypothetical protein